MADIAVSNRVLNGEVKDRVALTDVWEWGGFAGFGSDALPLHVALFHGAPADVSLAVLRANPAAAREQTTVDAGGSARMLPLYLAIMIGGQAEVVLAVLGANPRAAGECVQHVYRRGNARRLPLHLALQRGAPAEVILTVLRAEPRAALAWAEDDDGDCSHSWLPLHLALLFGAPAEVTLAVLGAHRGAVREWATDEIACGTPQLPLHVALRKGAPEEVALAVLRAGPSAAQATDESDDLPLHAALQLGASTGLIAALFEAYPAAASDLLQVASSIAMRGDFVGLAGLVGAGAIALDGFASASQRLDEIEAWWDASDATGGGDEEYKVTYAGVTQVRRVLQAWHRGSVGWCRLLERSLAQRVMSGPAQAVRMFVCGGGVLGSVAVPVQPVGSALPAVEGGRGKTADGLGGDGAAAADFIGAQADAADAVIEPIAHQEPLEVAAWS